MADIAVPNNVSSVTFSTSGVKAAASGIVTGITANEATAVCNLNAEPYLQKTNQATGATDIFFPDNVLTSITIAGTAYPITAGLITNVPAAAATAFLIGAQGKAFRLIQG
jgi:hypothetical protein